jgi:hypothetical protein
MMSSFAQKSLPVLMFLLRRLRVGASAPSRPSFYLS